MYMLHYDILISHAHFFVYRYMCTHSTCKIYKMCMCLRVCMCVYIYMYIYIYMYVDVVKLPWCCTAWSFCCCLAKLLRYQERLTCHGAYVRDSTQGIQKGVHNLCSTCLMKIPFAATYYCQFGANGMSGVRFVHWFFQSIRRKWHVIPPANRRSFMRRDIYIHI